MKNSKWNFLFFYRIQDNIEMVSSSNLVCVVCHLKTNTLAELHRHQTFLHSAEELSLAAISQQSIFTNNEFPTKNSTLGSSLNPYKSPAFYFLSARLLNDNNSLGFDRSVPLDCVMQKKDPVGGKSRLPKAGLLETRRKNNFIRRQQYRRDGILRASNAGVLDLSLPKKSGKSKSKSCNLIATIFDLEKNETGSGLDGKKNKKASKKTTKKHKLLDNVSPIKMEPLLLEDKHDEEKVEISELPGTRVYFRDGPSRSQAISLKNEHDFDKDESWNFHGNNEKDNKMEEYFPLDACPPSIPLQESNFSPKPEVVYDLQNEQNEEPIRKKKKARKGKQNTFPHGNGTKTSKKSKKSTLKDDIEKNTRNKKSKKCETIKNFDDNTCLDMSQVHEENDVAEKAVDEQVKIPDEVEEFFTNAFSDISDHGMNLQLDDFAGVTEFPTYPKDMDEYSILVFDPESRGLVWSSFELVDEPRSPNIDERSQDIQNDIELEIGETTLKNNCRNILFDCLTAARPQQEKNAFYEPELREDEASLEIKDTSADSFRFQRSKRRRTMPDRYVPW